ncbi:hypothetical protein CR513_59605, partial [Mucuna pruriens]
MPTPRTEIEGQLHRPIHFSTDGHLQPNILTPAEEPEDGVESRMPRSLWKSQAILGVTSCSRPNSTRQILILYLTMLKESMGGILG